MGNRKLYILFSIIAWLFCIGAPAVATLIYFPLWVEKSAESTMAGGTLFLLLLSVIPLFNKIKEWFKKTPASWVIWTLIAVLLLILQSIVKEVVTIAFVGAGGNILGAIFFTIARGFKPLREVDNER